MFGVSDVLGFNIAPWVIIGFVAVSGVGLWYLVVFWLLVCFRICVVLCLYNMRFDLFCGLWCVCSLCNLRNFGVFG